MKKCHFEGRNDGIWPKNDDPPMKSFSLTHFQSKSCTNLHEYEFWGKKEKERQNENLVKKCHFRGQNDGIWRKMMNLLWGSDRWPIFNRKGIQICVNLNSGAKKKWIPKQKFSKKCHFGGWNDGIWPKMMNFLWSPSCWPISNKKVIQICVNLNSAQHKTSNEMKIYNKNAITKAKTMEFGQETMNLQ